MDTAPKKLYRSRTDRMIAGVCGGLGQYFEIDPVVFRLAFVLLALLDGVGILLYIILVIIIPNKGEAPVVGQRADDQIRHAADTLGKEAQEFAAKMRENKSWLSQKRNIVGLVIILIGVFALASNFISFDWLNFKFLLAVLLMLIGAYVMFKK